MTDSFTNDLDTPHKDVLDARVIEATANMLNVQIVVFSSDAECKVRVHEYGSGIRISVGHIMDKHFVPLSPIIFQSHMPDCVPSLQRDAISHFL